MYRKFWLNLVKFGRAVFEICQQTDRQTDRDQQTYTSRSQYFTLKSLAHATAALLITIALSHPRSCSKSSPVSTGMGDRSRAYRLGLLRGTAVERRSLAGKLSLSCPRSVADG